MAKKYVMALDAGTTSNRAIIFDENSKIVGVSQKEFYLSQKEGLQASASAEIWRVDYEGERYAEFNGQRYRVIRSFPSSFDCLTLMLAEVVR